VLDTVAHSAPSAWGDFRTLTVTFFPGFHWISVPSARSRMGSVSSTMKYDLDSTLCACRHGTHTLPSQRHGSSALKGARAPLNPFEMKKQTGTCRGKEAVAVPKGIDQLQTASPLDTCAPPSRYYGCDAGR